MSRLLTGLIIAGFLTGCQVQNETTSLPAEPLTVQITPALEWLKPAMANCANQIPYLSLTVQSASQPDQSLDDANVLIRWSDSPAEEGQTFKLGEDRLVIIVHPANSLKEMDRSQLSAVYSGSVVDWLGLSEGSTGTIQPWTYPIGDDAEMLFAAKAIPYDEIIATTRIASDPQAMLDGISSDPLSIGMSPARWLNSSVKSIQISGYTSSDWTLPILAVTKEEPSGPVRDWLLCVQDNIQP